MLPQRLGGLGGYGGTSARLLEEVTAHQQQQQADMFSRAATVTQVTAPQTILTGAPHALSQRELYEAMSGAVIDSISRLGLVERHQEVLEAVSKVVVNVPPPDLTPIMQRLSQLLTLKDSHNSEVLEAITNVTVEQPDLSPIMRAIAQQNLQDNTHKEMMEAITNIVVEPPDLTPMQQMMQEIKAEFKNTVDNLRKDIQDDLSVLQQEVLKNRQETRNDAEVLLADHQEVHNELRKNAQVLLADHQEVHNELRRMDNKSELQQAEVLRALEELKAAELDTASILRMKLKVDNTEVLQAIKALELDQPAFATLVVDKMRKVTFNVDNAEVLVGIRRLPDQEVISRAVYDKMTKTFPNRNDFAELVETVRRIRFEPDFSPILAALHADVDFSPILDAISRVKLDQTPVLEAIRRIEVPDVEAVGRVVGDRIRRANLSTREDSQEILNAVRRIPDNSEVLDALRSLEPDNSEVLSVLRGLSIPGEQVIATAVLEKLRRANLQTDSTDLQAGLNAVRLAIGEAGRAEMSILIQEINKVQDHSDILRAIGNIQLELRQLRENQAVMMQQRAVVQTVVPQQTQVVKQVVQAQPQVQVVQSQAPPMVRQMVQEQLPQRVQSQPIIIERTAVSREDSVDRNNSPRIVSQRLSPRVEPQSQMFVERLSPMMVTEVIHPKVERRPVEMLRPGTSTYTTSGLTSLLPQAQVRRQHSHSVASEVPTEIVIEEREDSYTPRSRPASFTDLLSGQPSPVDTVFLQAQEACEKDELAFSGAQRIGMARPASRARFPGAASF